VGDMLSAKTAEAFYPSS